MIIDTSVHLGAWPFRFLPWEGTAALSQRLARAGIGTAWVTLFEGLLHKDLSAVNERLVRECTAANQSQNAVRFIPFGVVNPRNPDWRGDLQRCVERHALRGIRLYPGAHGYSLTDADVAALLEAAAGQGVLVQIVMKIEDERTQHPKVNFPLVDLTPLPGLIARIPELKVQIVNAQAAVPDEVLIPLSRTRRVWFDFAMIEGVAGVGRFAERVGSEQLLFGSWFPLFYPESAQLKLVESGLPESQLQAIRAEQAAALVTPR